MGICQSAPSKERQDIDLALMNYQEELKYLYVITVVFNPARSRSTIKLYNLFKSQMDKLKIKLVTVECAYADSPFTVTLPNYEPINIQLKTKSAFFQKENLINIAYSKLPHDAKYIMIIDYEVEFKNSQWVYDSIKTLNVLKIAQLFEEAAVLDSGGEEMKRDKGFAFNFFSRPNYPNEGLSTDRKNVDSPNLATGYAWGFRADAFHELGGLLDFSPLGNAERIMAACLLQKSDEVIPSGINSRCFRMAKDWEDKATSMFQAGIAYIPGTILVNWTGAKRGKKHFDRWDILEKNDFDPRYDLKKDQLGLYSISENKPRLAEDLKIFFQSVNGEMMNDKF